MQKPGFRPQGFQQQNEFGFDPNFNPDQHPPPQQNFPPPKPFFLRPPQRKNTGIPLGGEYGGDLPNGMVRIFTKTIFVGNLAMNVDEATLRSVCARQGNVQNLIFKADKHIAFVTYETRKEAEGARNSLHQKDLEGRPMKVGWGKVHGAAEEEFNFNVGCVFMSREVLQLSEEEFPIKIIPPEELLPPKPFPAPHEGHGGFGNFQGPRGPQGQRMGPPGFEGRRSMDGEHHKDEKMDGRPRGEMPPREMQPHHQGGFAPRNCFVCQEPGHIARECPVKIARDKERMEKEMEYRARMDRDRGDKRDRRESPDRRDRDHDRRDDHYDRRDDYDRPMIITMIDAMSIMTDGMIMIDMIDEMTGLIGEIIMIEERIMIGEETAEIMINMN